jgi:two-component sensor histidine kinase
MIWEKLLRAGHRQSAVSRWALAFVFLGMAVAVRAELGRVLSGEPFITFFPAIIGAAVLCGWRQATVMMLLSAAVAWAAFMPPTFAWAVTIEKPLALCLYFGVSSFQIALVSALLHAVRANHRLVRQQETLFRELQHRVANTLQFIAAMLTMSRQQITRGEDAAAALEDAAARISATGKLHRKLHDAAQYERGLAPLLREVLADMFRGLPVAVQVEVEGVALPLSQMTPVVLLVTEAATNSLKHVFRLGRGGTFKVRLADDGQALQLTICDDGPGLGAGLVPPGDRPSGLGLQIMKGLAAQLGGKLNMADQNGATLAVRFKRP